MTVFFMHSLWILGREHWTLNAKSKSHDTVVSPSARWVETQGLLNHIVQVGDLLTCFIEGGILGKTE